MMESMVWKHEDDGGGSRVKKKQRSKTLVNYKPVNYNLWWAAYVIATLPLSHE